ncbi:54S ribosomal protein L38 [Drechslerella dactyloides]|uniref:54S ribosomal protein L38 n=1 Tax=Drechslerella dactyloides TaxID=74499 RepID=A0AAD6J293_DREDA|nr:54S ribosomal protein L38 [Drechslerella dactyloides]
MREADNAGGVIFGQIIGPVGEKLGFSGIEGTLSRVVWVHTLAARVVVGVDVPLVGIGPVELNAVAEVDPCRLAILPPQSFLGPGVGVSVNVQRWDEVPVKCLDKSRELVVFGEATVGARTAAGVVADDEFMGEPADCGYGNPFSGMRGTGNDNGLASRTRGKRGSARNFQAIDGAAFIGLADGEGGNMVGEEAFDELHPWVEDFDGLVVREKVLDLSSIGSRLGQETEKRLNLHIVVVSVKRRERGPYKEHYDLGGLSQCPRLFRRRDVEPQHDVILVFRVKRGPLRADVTQRLLSGRREVLVVQRAMVPLLAPEYLHDDLVPELRPGVPGVCGRRGEDVGNVRTDIRGILVIVERQTDAGLGVWRDRRRDGGGADLCCDGTVDDDGPHRGGSGFCYPSSVSQSDWRRWGVGRLSSGPVKSTRVAVPRSVGAVDDDGDGDGGDGGDDDEEERSDAGPLIGGCFESDDAAGDASGRPQRAEFCPPPNASLSTSSNALAVTFGPPSPPTMIQLKPQGAAIVECVKVLGQKRHGRIGDRIVVVVQRQRNLGSADAGHSASQQAQKVRKGDIRHAVIVRTKKTLQRKDGSVVRFDDNACVLVNKAGEPIGSRMNG